MWDQAKNLPRRGARPVSSQQRGIGLRRDQFLRFPLREMRTANHGRTVRWRLAPGPKSTQMSVNSSKGSRYCPFSCEVGRSVLRSMKLDGDGNAFYSLLWGEFQWAFALTWSRTSNRIPFFSLAMFLSRFREDWDDHTYYILLCWGKFEWHNSRRLNDESLNGAKGFLRYWFGKRLAEWMECRL